MAYGEVRVVEVRVHPGSARRGVVVKEGAIHVYTRKKPEKGEANSDVARLVSEYFKVPKSAVELVRGVRSKLKIFRIAPGRGGNEGRA